MIRTAFMLVALFPGAALACDYVHLMSTSKHIGAESSYNERNPGAMIECSRFGFGAFRNSESTTSAIAYYHLPMVDGRRVRLGAALGGATGYESMKVAPVIAFHGAVFLSRDVGLSLILMPGVEYKEHGGESLIGVAVMALSVRI